MRADKKFTLFLISSERGSTKKVTVSAGFLRLMGFGLCAFVCLVFAAAVDYVGLVSQAMENKRLISENTVLRKSFEEVESKVVALESSLERVKSFYTKLKMITNTEDRERALNLAIGPLPKPGQNFVGSPYDDGFDESRMATALNEQGEQAQMGRAVAADGDGHDHAHDHGYARVDEVPAKEINNEIKALDRQNYTTLAVRIDRTIAASQLKEQNIIDLWQSLAERKTLLSSTPSIRPVRGWLTSKFGYRLDPFSEKIVMHNGLDFAAAPGAPVHATADGVVSFAGYDEAYGRLVTIDHGFGVITRFAHNSRLFVSPGQRVKRWDLISEVGSTGRSTGPHLHYEVRVNGVPVDPANYILD